MSRLVMAMHRGTGEPMVEVFDDDGTFVGAIYPVPRQSAVHIVSKYFEGGGDITPSDGGPPGYLVKFRGEPA